MRFAPTRAFGWFAMRGFLFTWVMGRFLPEMQKDTSNGIKINIVALTRTASAV
jgi:hypothetical protein